MVHREVVRIVTPGTLTEDTLLDARRSNFLAALADAQGSMALAWVEVSTGEVGARPVDARTLASALARLDPAELLVPDRLIQAPGLLDVLRDWRAALVPLPGARFDSTNGRKRLEALYGVGTLDAFGVFDRPELAALGALVDYVELTQKGKLPRLKPPRRVSDGGVMEIDPATRRNLELTRTLSGERQGSFLDVVDRTVSGAGARLLAERLAAPLTDPLVINGRLDGVESFVADEGLKTDLRQRLKRAPDLARALSRLSLGRGGPRDLAAIRDGLAAATEIADLIGRKPDLAAEIREAGRDLGHHQVLIDRFTRALAAELPLLARDGGFIAEGYAPDLDELRLLRDESRKLIAGLQARYQAETGIASLKIRHNNVLGYYIEATATHAEKIIGKPGFIHRQTMVNAVRFTTVELGELESKLSSAADRALAVELRLFEDLAGEVQARAEAVTLAADALARLDVASALAELAVERRHVRPQVDATSAFAVKGGRHPVVEAALAGSGASFVPNDCDLAERQRLWLLTGPNMAGKSTFLRQNALIVLLAQIGAFVPAESAHVGIVDRLFSRVGAADDLARGRSTFMVEMVETAIILNQASPRSLVILDEIGRGTATFDGLSIAWATLEHLHEVNRCRALFATHYHELTALASRLAALACRTMRVKEWQGDVVFLHEIAIGAADRSYGLHVARLAGLPSAVLDRAEEVLHALETGERAGSAARLADDLPLFAAARPVSGSLRAEPSAVEGELAKVNPDELSPKGALEILYRLKGLVQSRQ